MENNFSLDLRLWGANAKESKAPFKKHQHPSLFQLQAHFNNETSGRQKQVIDEHMLHCDRCLHIWDGLVHFSEKHKGSNVLRIIETRLLKLIASQDLTVLGLKGFLVLIVIAVSLGLITYDFGENKISAFANIPIAQVPEVGTESTVESVTPVIDLMKQRQTYLSNTFQSAQLEADQPPSDRDFKEITMDPEIKKVSSPTSNPITPIATKAKETSKIIPLEDNPHQNNDTNPMPRKATFRTISGIVVSEDDGAPLAGVKVTIPGLSVAVFTDQEGAYQIGVPIKRTNLVFDHKNAQVLQPLDSTNQQVNVTMPTLKVAKDKVLNISPYPITSEAYYKTYLKHNIKYPARALRNNIAGDVIVAFTVEADGSLTNLRVSQSLGYGCDKEAIRLVAEGPDWNPALVNGEPVPKEAILLVNFKR